MTAGDVLALLDRLILGAADQDPRADISQLADMLEDAGFTVAASIMRERGEFNGVQTLVATKCEECGSTEHLSLAEYKEEDEIGTICPECHLPIGCRVCPNCQCMIFDVIWR